jgi:hypothetical protein
MGQFHPLITNRPHDREQENVYSVRGGGEFLSVNASTDTTLRNTSLILGSTYNTTAKETKLR